MKQIRQIVPSILTADFTKISEYLNSLHKIGMKMVHLDVMDGHFVPNITFGPAFVNSLRKHVSAVFDVHLMISDPEKYIPQFIAAGADYITFHYEPVLKKEKIMKLINLIKKSGRKPGISVNPKTDITKISPYLKYLELVLVMTVEPGFGAQSFMYPVLSKITQLRKIIDKNKYHCLIEVDGGINEKTCVETVKSGANLLVAGNAIFGKNDYKQAYLDLTCQIHSI